jgi:hypothetical protein
VQPQLNVKARARFKEITARQALELLLARL